MSQPFVGAVNENVIVVPESVPQTVVLPRVLLLMITRTPGVVELQGLDVVVLASVAPMIFEVIVIPTGSL